MLKLFLILMCVLTPLACWADLFDYRLSLNEWAAGDKCRAINKAEVQALQDQKLCSPMDLSTIVSLQKNVNEAIESRLFSEAAAEQLKTIRCELPQMNRAIGPTVRAKEFRRKIIDDIALKLPALRTLYTEMVAHAKAKEEYQKKIEGIYRGVNRSMLVLSSSQVQTDLKVFNQRVKFHDAQMYQHSRPFNALMMTTWNGHEEKVSEFVINVIKSGKSPEVFAKQAALPYSNHGYLWPTYSLEADVLKPMKFQLEKTGEYLMAQSADKKGRAPFRTNFATRAMLVKYSDLMDKLAADPKDRLESLMCRLNSRYVKGDARVKITLFTAATLMTGFAGRLASLATASRMSVYLQGAEAASLLRWSRSISMMGKMTEYSTVVERINRMCFNGQPAHINKGCFNNSFDVSAGKHMYLENCAFAVAMAVDPVWIKMGKNSSKAFKSYMMTGKLK